MTSRWILIVIAASACASEKFYRPTEHVTAEGKAGEPASSYEIRSPDGTRVADVNVWAKGKNATGVVLGMEVRNVSDQPLALDTEDTKLMQVPQGQLVGMSGQPVVAPGQVKDFDLAFAAPEHTKAFQLRWSLVGAGERFRHFTPFVQDVVHEDYAYAPVYGYYDPFFYDPFFYPPTNVVVVHGHRYY